jgi:chitodextrinase/regulation of enolase protein 1 (concanavalin A-like superfamily)
LIYLYSALRVSKLGQVLALSLPVLIGLVTANTIRAASVKDYGATGNGTTDDTAPIQTAINTCPSGGSILFPAGSYKLSGTLYLQSNCSYIGQGAPVLLGYQGTGAGGYQIFELDGSNGSANNVTIGGLIFDGGGTYINETSANFGQTINKITISNNIFRNIINSNVTFGAFQAAIFIEGGTLTNSSIDHNFFSHLADANRVDNGYSGSLSQDSFKYGVQIHSAANTSINNNVFDWIAGDGIHIGELEQLIDHSGIQVQNNIFTRLHRNAIEIQIWDAFGAVVSGNLGGHFVYGYWNTGGLSFASDGAITSQNNVWDGWNDLDTGATNGLGYCEEIWGTGSIVSHVLCASALGTVAGYSFFAAGVDIGHHEWVVPGTSRTFADNITIQDGTYCGQYVYGVFANETSSPPYPTVTYINDSTPAGCSAFPTPPHNLTATVASAAVVTLSWSAASDTNGITGYNVYRNADKIATVSGTTYQDTGLSGGNVYWYNVQAVDSVGNVGVGSDPALVTTPASSQPPTPPTALTATVVGSAQIGLSWGASTGSAGIAGYSVERCQGTGCNSFSQIGTSASTTFNDMGLSAGTSYSYRVRSTDGAGSLSGYSNTAIATTAAADTQAPTVPAGLTPSAAPNEIDLSWTASTDNVGVTGYYPERCQGAGCSNFSVIGLTSKTTYSDTSLTGGTSYTYRVRATDAAGNLSGYSQTATATTPAGTVGPPVSDNFNNSTLNTSLWKFINPVGNGSYSMSGSDLLLTVPAGSNHDPAYGGADNSVRVVQAITNVDFAVTVKFDSIPNQQYQFEGILVEQDAANYLRFQFGSTGNVLIANSAVIAAGVQTPQQTSTIAATGGSLWLRIQRSGSNWTESWSPDGSTYNTVGSFTQALTAANIGPFAGNYNNTARAAPAFTARLDYFLNTVQASAAGPVSDNFDASTLNTSLWKFISPVGNGSYSMTGSDMLLTTPSGSNHDPAYGGADNSVRVMQAVSNSDFTIEVKFDSIPNLQYQFQGIVVEQDSANYLRFQFGSTGSQLVVGASQILASSETGLFSPVISVPTGATSLWLRVQKSGSTWTEFWSTDGSTFNTCGSFTQVLNVANIGPFAGNYNNTATAAPAFTARIDYFFNNANRLAP